jgi:EmrB/QacA subfamily drug resistance transporter
VIAATVLGSGVAFLDGSVVNVALPSIGRDLHTDVAGLQWTIDAYLVTLTALLLFGGALGDRLGRKRVFMGGLVAFTVASVGCGAAPNATVLALARALQGAGGAFLVPGSLSIIAASFAEDDRARAIGTWSGLAAISGAVGPFLGGWLVDAASWRWVFLVNVPIAAMTIAVTAVHVPETRSEDRAPLDLTGAVLASLGLGGACWALIQGPQSVDAGVMAAAILGVGALAAFFVREARHSHPMLPLTLFRSAQFSGANGTTLAVYAALGAAFFMIVLELQLALHYSALESGAALLPITALILTLSARAGALAQRVGPRLPMTVGPVLVGVGTLLFTRIHPGSHYGSAVLPAAVVFGLGLAITVAPLTAAVFAAVDADDMGIASGVNNAAARLAGLLAVAVLPAVVHLDTTLAPSVLTDRVAVAMRICAVLCVLGGLIAWLTVRKTSAVTAAVPASVIQPCHDPSLARAAAGWSNAQPDPGPPRRYRKTPVWPIE